MFDGIFARLKLSRAILLSVSVLAMMAGVLVGTTPTAEAVTVVSTVTGPACPDVMVIAGRGSGEPPQANWTDASAYLNDPYKGVGSVNYDLYQRLVQSSPKLHFSLDAVMYPAASVKELLGAIANFKASAVSGADRIIADIQQTERTCGSGVKYAFLDYSQAVWSAHMALYRLPKTILAKIVGVAFFGDPEFVPNQEIVRDFKLDDVSNGVAVASGADLKNTNVPKSIRSVTGSWCFPHDPVCQSSFGNAPWLALCVANSPLCPHFNYAIDGETAKAAKFLTPNLPLKTVWPHLTLSRIPAGTVGTPYQWTATVAPTAHATYQWTASGTVPPGLTFSQNGVLSGTPTKAGSYSFTATATSDKGRTASGLVPVTIGGVVTPPPPPPPPGAGDWPQAGGDAGQSRYNAGETVLGVGNVGQVARQWSVDETIVGRSLVYQGYLYRIDYVTQPDGSYQIVASARAITDGSAKWSQVLGGSGTSADLMSIGAGVIVFGYESVFGGVRSHALKALNLADGTPAWSSGSGYSCWCGQEIQDGNNIIDTLGGGVQVHEAATGQQLWSLALHGNNLFAVSGGMIVIATRVANSSGEFVEKLEALDESDAHVIWSIDGPSDGGDYWNLIVGGSVVYVFNPGSGAMEARNLASGALLWQTPTYTDEQAAGIFTGPAATDGQTLYAATVRGIIGGDASTLRAFAGGQELWYVDLAGDSFPSAPAVANGVVYIAGFNVAGTEVVQAFEAATGHKLWTSPVRATQDSPFAAEGRLVIGGEVLAAG